MRTIKLFALVFCLFSSVVLAGKGKGKGGSGGSNSGPFPAATVLRDQAGDAVISDLGVAYQDDVGGADIKVDSAADYFRLQSSGSRGATITLGTPLDPESEYPFPGTTGYVTGFKLRIWMAYSDDQVFLPSTGDVRTNAGASIGFYSSDGSSYYRLYWLESSENTAEGIDTNNDGVADQWRYTLSETSVVELDKYRVRNNGALFGRTTVGHFTDMPFSFTFYAD